MSYLVLARKWRPQQLADILGQSHVTRTLENALSSGRIAHAFLFTGARGVGKTSAARILAKALCCEKGPTPTPCGVCNACVEIAEGRATDVFEIDAASNTGVANVREIIDNVRYLPSSARFKIYIIDEVHMLSTGAFNALLKTLEEPPAHVKFILATTDVHKVPVTILSRCQRYDFRRISLDGVADRLSTILSKEGVEHDPAALFLVARESEGSMRDAQSLLEQVIAFADGRRLDPDLVREALGVADRRTVEGVVAAILARDPGAVLGFLREVHERGFDMKRFADALVEEVRDLYVSRILPDPKSVLDRPADEVSALMARAKPLDPRALERIFRATSGIVEGLAEAPYPRFSLEIGLAALAEEPARLPVDALVDKLERLESLLSQERPSAPSAARGGAAGPRPFPAAELNEDPRPPPRGPAPDHGGSSFERSAPSGSFERSAPPPDRSPPSASFERSAPPPDRSAPSASFDRSAPSASFERSAPPDRGAPSGPPRGSFSDRPPQSRPPPPANKAVFTPPPPRTPTPPPAAPPPLPPLPPEDRVPAPSGFGSFVELIKKKRPTLGASLFQVRALEFRAGQVVIGVETSFDEAQLGSPDTERFLEVELTAFFGTPTKALVKRVERGQEAEDPAVSTLGEEQEQARADRREDKSKDARARPAVKAVTEVLGAKIARVRVVDEDA